MAVVQTTVDRLVADATGEGAPPPEETAVLDQLVSRPQQTAVQRLAATPGAAEAYAAYDRATAPPPSPETSFLGAPVGDLPGYTPPPDTTLAEMARQAYSTPSDTVTPVPAPRIDFTPLPPNFEPARDF